MAGNSDRNQKTTRVRMKRAGRRVQLLEKANEILEREGLGGLTMERLAETAAISKPVVYSHFENKSALLVGLLNDYWDKVDQAMWDFDSTLPFEENLRNLLASYFDFVVTEKVAIRQIVYKVVEDPIVEAARMEREREVVARWLARLSPYCRVSNSKAESTSLMIRAAQASAASYILRFPRRRQHFENLATVVCLALFDQLAATRS